MYTAALLLLLASLAAFLVGMVRPEWVVRWGTMRARGAVFLNYGLALSVSLVLFSMVERPPEWKKEEALPARQLDPKHYEMVARFAKDGAWPYTVTWGPAPEDVARLDGADFTHANLQGAKLAYAHLRGADFRWARLDGADLRGAHLEGADLGWGVHLEGADLTGAYLQGANLTMACVDGSTSLWRAKVSPDTDPRGVGLGSIRIDAGTRLLLAHNERRLNWERWYRQGWWRQPVRVFWWLSDYGASSVRVLGVFLAAAFFFANLYWGWVAGRDPHLVRDLFEDQGEPVTAGIVPFRAFYFSVVTMTTLGFGDIRADPRSLAGHLLITAQVFLGYFLLGGLLTRLAILFTAGGPAEVFH